MAQNIQLINKKIDNTSNILLLNSAIWDYQEFLRDLPTSTANKNSQLKTINTITPQHLI